MRPDLVIFDCDGVLVDSEPVTDAVIAKNLARYGLKVDTARVHELFIGGTMRGVRDQAVRMGADLPANWLDEVYDETFTALGEGVPLVAGIEGLLDAIERAGIATAIVSNGPRRKMEITLKPSGLWERFSPRIHSAHDEFRPKPDPHMLRKAMAQAGATPERTVFIDDSLAGSAAGPRAGVRTFGLDPAGRVQFPGGVEPIAALSEVAALIGLL